LLIFQPIARDGQRVITTFKIKTRLPLIPQWATVWRQRHSARCWRELSADHIKLLIAANPALVDLQWWTTSTGKFGSPNRGVAVLLVSEDLDELLKLSDRVW
jgi:simple sugar transport system ATP-binding protein